MSGGVIFGSSFMVLPGLRRCDGRLEQAEVDDFYLLAVRPSPSRRQRRSLKFQIFGEVIPSVIIPVKEQRRIKKMDQGQDGWITKNESTLDVVSDSSDSDSDSELNLRVKQRSVLTKEGVRTHN